MRSSAQQLLKTLRSVEILRELSISQLQRLRDALSEVKVADGEYVIREGDPGRDFFVVIEGTARVLKKRGTGEEEGVDEVMRIEQYDYFGERALMNDAPRAASVKASGPMKLLQISKAHFEEVLGSLQDIIDAHRRRREEGARRAYLRRQAEGLLDAKITEFNPVCELFQLQSSSLYLARRKEREGVEQRLVLRVISKKLATDEDLRGRIMGEIKLVGEMLPHPTVPSLLATFSDRNALYAVMGCILSTDLASLLEGKPLIDDTKKGEETLRFFIAALSLTLMHLHKQEIICRTCTLESINLDHTGYPHLIDFSLSKKLSDVAGGRTRFAASPSTTRPNRSERAATALRATGGRWASSLMRCYLGSRHLRTGRSVARRLAKRWISAGRVSAVAQVLRASPTMASSARR